ncbi:hypothetical protein DB35_02475 [Streptomyces abyssalis]|uniref:Uncharacterized protein n=1 Tax=Streptomyces abyssalis TaxID=933944 RepID=A0A1E7JPK1_9ACTN|nr:hypothetical protein AN215_11625 [Streptomyces abyssalis]OEU94920.1 hypothetical protein DB35_02475 [Streptomyces abyssalis]
MNFGRGSGFLTRTEDESSSAPENVRASMKLLNSYGAGAIVVGVSTTVTSPPTASPLELLLFLIPTPQEELLFLASE